MIRLVTSPAGTESDDKEASEPTTRVNGLNENLDGDIDDGDDDDDDDDDEDDEAGSYNEKFITKLLKNYRSHTEIIKVSDSKNGWHCPTLMYNYKNFVSSLFIHKGVCMHVYIYIYICSGSVDLERLWLSVPKVITL